MASYNLNLVRVVERPEQYFPRKQLCTRLPDGGLFRYTYADFGPRVRRLASALGADLMPLDALAADPTSTPLGKAA